MIIWTKRLVLAFLILNFFGCSPLTSTGLPDGRYVPKEPKFSINPENYSYEDIGLDFNSIYYNETKSYYNNIKHVFYSYYRFWPNGRVMKKLSETFLKKEDVELLNEAEIGYYYVKGNELVMELFFPDSTILNWDYITIYGRIKSDMIEKKYSVIRGKIENYRPNSFYIKKQFKNLTTQPDW